MISILLILIYYIQDNGKLYDTEKCYLDINRFLFTFMSTEIATEVSVGLAVMKYLSREKCLIEYYIFSSVNYIRSSSRSKSEEHLKPSSTTVM